MTNFPTNPHAFIEVSSGNSVVARYDSWEDKQLFKGIDVELTTGQLSMATWQVFDPDFKLINAFTENRSVKSLVFRIYLGTGKDLGQPVFKGVLADVERDKTDTIFTIYDMGFKMKQAKKAQHHSKKNDLDIIKALAVRNELLFSPPPDAKKLEPHKTMVQTEQTDWEHAMERARDSGLLLFVRQDTLFARYPAKLARPKLILQNRNPTSFYDFRITFKTPENENVRPQVVEFRGRGKGGKRLTGKSTTNTKGRKIISARKGVSGKHTVAKLSARAQAQKELEREHAFEGNIAFPYIDNNIRLDVRDTIGIEGIGNLFSEPYICDTVNYHFGAGKMEISIDLYRDFTEE